MAKDDCISIDFLERVSDALSEESDRACVILVASWIAHFLRIKLAQEFSKGNSEARHALFSFNGPFATVSAKLNAVFCADWIDSDVYHDLQVIRKLRNTFAHSIDSHTLHEEPFPAMVAKLRVPKRQFHDWGQLSAATTDTGVVFFTGERPDEATDDLDVSKISFRMGASVIIAVLVANLGIHVDADGLAGTVLFELPEHMREISE
ncbi:MAG: hypothetical protein KAS72_04220 [Phycisphaerales bacterium]|nr:hypothetical protein [Phycisphaerales bacterium]